MLVHLTDREFDPQRFMILGIADGDAPGNSKAERDAYYAMEINDLVQHSNVFGLTGTGKSFFIEQLVNQLQRYKKGSIGILVINYAKKRQEIFFTPDIILRYGDESFVVPYFVKPKDDAEILKAIEQSAHNIVATMGLKYVVKRILPIIMVKWWEQKGQLPESVFQVLSTLVAYIKKNPYAPEFQANLLQATLNRINDIVKDARLVNTLRLMNDMPAWFAEWMHGKTVFIDLSSCDSIAKQLLTYCIFQMVRVFIPHDETNELKHLIIIDEAHQILRQPATNDPDDDDFITMVQTQAIFESLLKEFRSMGVGIVIADQQPSSLITCAHSLASNKFLFRLNYPCNTLFFANTDLRDKVARLANRTLLVMVEGKQAVLRTFDSDPIERPARARRDGDDQGLNDGHDVDDDLVHVNFSMIDDLIDEGEKIT